MTRRRTFALKWIPGKRAALNEIEAYHLLQDTKEAVRCYGFAIGKFSLSNLFPHNQNVQQLAKDIRFKFDDSNYIPVHSGKKSFLLLLELMDDPVSSITKPLTKKDKARLWSVLQRVYQVLETNNKQHGDSHPRNVMYRDYGNYRISKVGDFGRMKRGSGNPGMVQRDVHKVRREL